MSRKFISILDRNPEYVEAYWDYERNSKNFIFPESTKLTSSAICYLRCLTCGAVWENKAYNVAKGKTCPYCSGQRVLKGFNDLLTFKPDILKSWSDKNTIKPDEITRGSSKKVWLRCAKCGHEYETSPNNILQAQETCPVCNGYVVKSGVNDVYTLFPELVVEWDDVKDPKNIKATSKENIAWKCKICNNNFEASPYDRCYPVKGRLKGRGCPYCSGKRVLSNLNSISALFPEALNYWSYEDNDKNPEDLSYRTDYNAFWFCEGCGKKYQRRVDTQFGLKFLCGDCRKNSYSSDVEKELASFVEDLGFPIKRNVRLQGIGELDIYIPEKQTAIEFNGVYWHNEANKGTLSHYNKWKSCENKGITLLQIWEDDFRLRKEVVKNLIKSKLGVLKQEKVNARDCNIKCEISIPEVQNFLEANHIQGYTQFSFSVGLVDSSNLLVSIALFTRFKDVLVLSRFCSSCNVRGALGKILSYVTNKEESINKIITFSDNCISNGGIYKKLSFECKELIKPDYKYVINNRRVHKFNYRKERFNKDKNLQYVEGLTEKELADLNNMPRIWDAGKKKWVLEVN